MGSYNSLSANELNEEDVFTQPQGGDFYNSDLSSKDITFQQNGHHHRPNTRWSCIAYSDSHSLIAVGSAAGLIIVVGKDVVHHFQVDKGEAVMWLEFIRLKLCAVTRKGRLVFWDLVKRRRVRAAEPLNLCEITSACVIRNSKSRFIVLGQSDGKIRFFDSLKKRPCALVIPVLTNVGSLDPSSVLCAEFCPTQCNKLLISYNTENFIYLYNFVTREIHRTSRKEISKYRAPSICRTVTLSEQHPYFIAGCDDGTICVFRFGEFTAVKNIVLSSNPTLTPVYNMVLYEFACSTDMVEKSLYVSGGFPLDEKTSGLVRLDLSLPWKGEVEENSRVAITPQSGRTSDFCLHMKPMVQIKNQNSTELLIQNVEGEVQLFATQCSHHDSDESDKNFGETTHCSLFHSELNDVVDFSLCSGSGEDLKDFCAFERTTPLNLLGGDLLFEYECDYLATGHKSGLCIIWKITRREYFTKILEINVSQLSEGNGADEKTNPFISAINMSGRIITVGMESGDVFEIKLSGVKKDGSELLWGSKKKRKIHKNSVVWIRRSKNALVIVDRNSITSVQTTNGKLLSVFAALDGFEADKELRITWISVQPSILISESVIYFGFSNGAWRLCNFSGNPSCFGPLAEKKFKTAITYIARLNLDGELSKCKPNSSNLSPQQADISAFNNTGAILSPLGSLCSISSYIVTKEAQSLDADESVPLPIVSENEVEKDEDLKIETLGSQSLTDVEQEVKSQLDNITVPIYGARKARRGRSWDSSMLKVKNELLEDENLPVSEPGTPVARGSQKSKKESHLKRKIKGFVKKGNKRNYSTPVTFWSREGGRASHEQDILKGERLSSNNSLSKVKDSRDLSQNREQDSGNKLEPLVSTILSESRKVEQEKRETTEESQNEVSEDSYEEISDDYLVICSRDKVVVIQIQLPDFKICARYSFQSPLLGAQVVSKEPGKAGLVTISENGRCNIFRLMDLHVLQSTDMKIPMLINMVMLPAGRYVAVNKRMEFFHGGLFETSVELSFLVPPTLAPSEKETETKQQVHHKTETSGLFSLFSRKTEIVLDDWDDALEALEDSNKSLLTVGTSRSDNSAPKAKHRHMTSDPVIKRKAPKSGQRTVYNENLDKINERGEMISRVGDKSAQMKDSAQRFSELAKQLRKKNQSWF
jgi:hypothetical protein